MRVLLATDGSKHAEHAAAMLAHLPHSEKLELTVLSIVPTVEMHGSMEVVEWLKQNLEAEKVRATEACGRVAAMFQGANAQIESVVVEGHAGQSILGIAKERGIELIVMGSLGHSTLDRLLLGSVSDFVATHATCSVLVVRPHEIKASSELKLCVAYDDSSASKQAIARLEQFDWRRNTRIDVLNLMLLPISYSEIPIEIDTTALREEMERVVGATAEHLRKLSPTVEAHVIDANHVGDGLVRFAEEHNSDVIVMGDTGRGLLGRFLLGSVSRYVLRHAHCSVWIARGASEA
jgi:nucleotide-binding universal stress UspA family protein